MNRKHLTVVVGGLLAVSASLTGCSSGQSDSGAAAATPAGDPLAHTNASLTSPWLEAPSPK